MDVVVGVSVVIVDCYSNVERCEKIKLSLKRKWIGTNRSNRWFVFCKMIIHQKRREKHINMHMIMDKSSVCVLYLFTVDDVFAVVVVFILSHLCNTANNLLWPVGRRYGFYIMKCIQLKHRRTCEIMCATQRHNGKRK